MKKTIIIGTPHGGTLYGHDGLQLYMQKGKQSPSVPPGIYEGEWIRELIEDLSEEADRRKIFRHFYFLFSAPTETPPNTRRRMVNMLVKELKRNGSESLYIEPHVNADGHSEWTDAEGHRVFYNEKAGRYKALDLSDSIHSWKPIKTKERSPLESKFPWINKMHCPALLAELFFMTNKKETEAANTFEGLKAYTMGLMEFCEGWVNS
jgi:hypothetical protein